VGLLDKILVDEVRVVASKSGAIAYLNPASGALLSAELSEVRWHFGCRTEREQRCIFGNGADHEIESVTAMIDPARRDAFQDIEITRKYLEASMCGARARPANFACEMH
jgi:hypothetical protein